MDIFVEKLGNNKDYEVYFAFCREDLKDLDHTRATGKKHVFDLVENIVKSAPEFFAEDEHFVEYCCIVSNSWLLNELISSDFQGSIKTYEEVYMVRVYEIHNSFINQAAKEIICDIGYELSNSNITINKFMITDL